MKTREEVKELRGVAEAELARRLEQAHEELFNLRFRHATRQLDNYREIPRVKRRIARIVTLMRERELGGETE
ncbi:MAG: 50S ribosomal protein L29 [Chloroflexi bacterium]|nr:50S ribosomal protein L29 [Chloroflexota bacterium]